MGYRPTDKDRDNEERAARRQHDAANRAVAAAAVKEWNRLMERRFKPGFSPTIGLAIAAEFYFLDVLCPGCRQLKQVDLRTLKRHPQTQLFNIVPSLSCQNCKPSSPRAQILKLSQHEWSSPNAPIIMPKRAH